MTSTPDTSAVSRERLCAHAEWLARGRSGDGRLVLENATLVGSLREADLRHAELDSCGLGSVDLANARLDGARFERCTFERADLRRASLVETRFEDCDLRRAMVAGTTIAKTGFLRCAFGDFGSQPIGKPDVRGAYVVVSPDLSSDGDGSRIGSAAEVDARWFTLPHDGVERRFVFEAQDGSRFVALVLHMHLSWSREAGPRLQDRAAQQSFGQFLAEGAPSPFREALPKPIESKLRELVSTLHVALPHDGTGPS